MLENRTVENIITIMPKGKCWQGGKDDTKISAKGAVYSGFAKETHDRRLR